MLSLVQVLGIDPGEERWRKVVDNFKPHLNNAILLSWSEEDVLVTHSLNAERVGLFDW